MRGVFPCLLVQSEKFTCTDFPVNLCKIVHNENTVPYIWTACFLSHVQHVVKLGALGDCSWLLLGSILVMFSLLCFFLTRIWTVHFLFPPLYSSVLKPDFNLCFSQIKWGSKVMSLGPNHVLLAIELLFQSLELFGCENCANSLWLSLLEIPSLVFFMVNNWKDCFSFCNNKI